jgi:hypothetical protein
MNRIRLQRIALVAALAAGLTAAACTDGYGLRAKRVERYDELIGGPTAKGKIGDFLLENDRIRVVVSGNGPSYTAGLFGGTVLDVDLQRAEAQYRAGNGFDSFAEAFPLANLLVVNPSSPKQAFSLTEDGIQLVESEGSVRVLKDGSDGTEATIRVEGHSAYMFDVMKFLNRDFIEGLLDPLSIGGMELTARQLADFLPAILGEPELNLFGLLNRLQISFDFVTDYTLRPGESYLHQTTTLTLSPQSVNLLDGCRDPGKDKALAACTLKCDYGYAVEERIETDPEYEQPYKRMCPVCACAQPPAQMATFNESRDFFKVLLGDVSGWVNPTWKGGVVAGDFLFFGSNAPPFAPGFGFDIDRKVFENMWQGVGTMGSPMSMDWVAGVGEYVSYAWTTINPNEAHGFDCPSFRFVVRKVADVSREDDVAQALTGQDDLDLALNLAAKDAGARVRQAIVDRRPIPLMTVVPEAGADPGGSISADQRMAAFAAWQKAQLDSSGAALEARLGSGVEIDLVPAHECMSSKVLVPLFSTSATAVLTHFADGDSLVPAGDGGNLRDDKRTYTFTRYLTVGEGDVASAVRHVYEIRGVPTGTVEGAVFEAQTLRPLSHVDVYLLRDPRKSDDDPLPKNWQEFRLAAVEAFGSPGIVTHMRSDVGVTVSLEGLFNGSVEPGRYLAVASAPDRGQSSLEPVEVVAGGSVRVNLVLPPAGSVEYRVTDQAGLALPSRLSFQRLDDDGTPLDWTGTNEPELGDSRYDHGVVRTEHSPSGTGTVALAPGRYRVVVSRGFEYGAKVFKDFEVRGGSATPLHALLPLEMDTRDHLSADLHVHAEASVDSSLPMETRVRAAVAEGVEHFAATDHDHIVDYLPWILRDGLESFLNFQIAAEVSPLEYGHYIAYPMQYDDRAGFLHDPPRWHGLTLREIFDGIRAARAGPEDAFVFQVNHPRDGFMGYFAQIGMKGYDLSRKTPGMEMCNQVMQEAPCDFEAMEIMNGKNLQYLHTPTVGELERHNRCYREIVTARNTSDFPYRTGAGQTSVCNWFLDEPQVPAGFTGCSSLAAADLASLSDDQRLARDRCDWHREARDEFQKCEELGNDQLIPCKRFALEALKELSVRYLIERTDDENDAYYGTTAETDIGCSHKDACSTCVVGNHPECEDDWSTECVLLCRDECPLDDARPCTDRFEMMQDWFHFLDVGFDVTALGNSDSHGVSKEIGHPRNYVRVGTDRPDAVDPFDVNRAILAGKVVVSAGPYVEFSMAEAGNEAWTDIGDTLVAGGSGKLKARIRVQTPSWFRVDRIEVWRNSRIEARFFTTEPVEAIVDFDREIELDRPAEDSWYVVIAYGVSKESSMSPVYKREPYGNILISTVISLAADQLLASFSSLLDRVGDLLGGSLDSLTGSLEMPDSYPSLPWGATNPIRVDVDGNGYRPPRAVDADGDGKWDLPAFCSKPCVPGDENACPEGQTCAPRLSSKGNGEGPAENICQIPTPAHCVGLQKLGQ